MTGQRKLSRANALMKVYQRKGIRYKPKDVQQMSVSQMAHEIRKLNGTFGRKESRQDRCKNCGTDITQKMAQYCSDYCRKSKTAKTAKEARSLEKLRCMCDWLEQQK